MSEKEPDFYEIVALYLTFEGCEYADSNPDIPWGCKKIEDPKVRDKTGSDYDLYPRFFSSINIAFFKTQEECLKLIEENPDVIHEYSYFKLIVIPRNFTYKDYQYHFGIDKSVYFQYNMDEEKYQRLDSPFHKLENILF